MRAVVVFLGVLLISVSHTFAADSSLDKYCVPNSPPQVCIEYTDAALKEHSRWLDANMKNHPIIDSCIMTKDPSGCIVSFRTNQPDAYALELAHMDQQLAQEEARHKTLLQEQAQFERRYQAERQQEDHLARQREQDHAIFLSTEQARLMAAEREFQLDLAREQSRGMALFGTGPALINGMNQGFNNMRLPIPYTPASMPSQPLYRLPVNCTTQTYGPQTQTTCY